MWLIFSIYEMSQSGVKIASRIYPSPKLSSFTFLSDLTHNPRLKYEPTIGMMALEAGQQENVKFFIKSFAGI